MKNSSRPLRPNPPPLSPSHSLFGLEKAIPPASQSTGLLPAMALYRTPSRSPSRSLQSTPSDFDKPLPEKPRKDSTSSSVYSGDSGYTKLVQSYLDRDEARPRVPTFHQPEAHRDTVSGLLSKCFSQQQSPNSSLSPPQVRPSQSIPSPHLTPHEPRAPSAIEQRQGAPTFVEFSRHLQQRRHGLVSPLSSKASENYPRGSVMSALSPPPSGTTPSFSPISLEQGCCYPRVSMAGPMSEVVDSSLVPAPLDLSRRSQLPQVIKSARIRHEINENERRSTPQQPTKRLSQDSFSDDSFVIYSGAREVVKAMIKEKVQRKKNLTKQNEASEMFSSRSQKCPGVKSSLSPQNERKFSWASSRQSSLQQGVSSLMRSLSINSPSSCQPNTPITPTIPRRREKQRAITTTPYQRYGMDIWLAKNKKKRAKNKAEQRNLAALSVEPARPRATSTTVQTARGRERMSGELAKSFQSGRQQLMHALDETKHKLTRTGSEKRREILKRSIKLVGPAELGEAVGEGDAWV